MSDNNRNITDDIFKIESLKYNNKFLSINKKLLISTIVLNATLAIATLFLAFDTHRLVASATLSNNIAIDNSKKTIRPYVLIKSILTENIPNNDMKSSITFKNAGQTPALEFWGFTGSAIVPFIGGDIVLQKYHIRNCTEPYEENGKFPIFQGDEITIHRILKFDSSFTNKLNNDKFSDSEISDFKSGRSGYVLRGVECYTDIFNELHVTYLCRYYVSVQDLMQNLFQACKKENEID